MTSKEDKPPVDDASTSSTPNSTPSSTPTKIPREFWPLYALTDRIELEEQEKAEKAQRLAEKTRSRTTFTSVSIRLSITSNKRLLKGN